MVKQIIVILILLLLAEIVGGVVLLSAFTFLPAKTQEKTKIYNNLNPQTSLSQKSLSSLKLLTEEKSWTIDNQTLKTWLAGTSAAYAKGKSSLANYVYSQTAASHPWASYNHAGTVRGGPGINRQALGQYLLELAGELNRPPQNAQLQIENGRATKFTPDLTGLVLDLNAAQKLIQTSLLFSLEQEQEIVLPIQTTEPKTRLGDLNNLGINTLVARGQSDFAGSPGNRIHNIKVGAARYNGLILKPGEEFSFNKSLGPVDGQHGFLPELVIKPEGTLPEFGGGLCQVSTTAFRAAFFGGLPITARKNHSYAVKYYEWIAPDLPRAVGLDATIYPGAQDLKFLNDTAGALLISTQIEGHKLYFDFYGTPDEREVVMDGPHPFDRRPSGAVKSKVRRTVIKDGEKQEITFNSNYVSPNLYPRIYEFPKPVEPQVQTNN